MNQQIPSQSSSFDSYKPSQNTSASPLERSNDQILGLLLTKRYVEAKIEIESHPSERSSKNSGNECNGNPVSAGKIAAFPCAGRHGDLLLHILCGSGLENNSFTQKDGVTGVASNEIDMKSGHCDSKESQLREERKMHDLFLILIRAYPDATRTRGNNGALPLHNAVKKGLSKLFIETLIRTFPQSLDVTDADRLTPRDYNHPDPETRTFIDRPASCWLRQLIDEESHNDAESYIRHLEEIVNTLEKDIEESRVRIAVTIANQITLMEDKAKTLAECYNGKKDDDEKNDIQNDVIDQIKTLEIKLNVLRPKLDLVTEKLNIPNGVKTFHDDIKMVYKTTISKSINEMKNDLQRLTQIAEKMNHTGC